MTISITLIIVILTCLSSYKVMESRAEKAKLMFIPQIIQQRKEYYRFLSHGFIHADWLHLGFNMIALYLFGESVENAFTGIFGVPGTFLFMLLYIGGIAAAALPNFYRHKDNPGYASLGASGAVSAVVLASVLLDPWQGIGFIFIPIFIPGFIVVAFYLWYSSYMSKRMGSRIDHMAHFAGSLFGIAFLIAIKPPLILNFFHCLVNRSTYCIEDFIMHNGGGF